MAKAFKAPKGCNFTYDFNDPAGWENADKKCLSYLRKFCYDNTDSKSSLVGETVNFPVADGYAVYMVYRTTPLQLIHVPIGDEWQADDCTIRGLRVKDIKERIECKKKLDKIFQKA